LNPTFGEEFGEVRIVATLRCNLQCKHCFYLEPREKISAIIKGEGSDGSSLFFEDKLQKNLEAILRNAIGVQITGGEPFVVPKRFFKLLELVAATGLKARISTNAMLLSKNFVQRLQDFHQAIRSIGVSLDGITANTHEFLRGRGTLKPTLRGLRHLATAGLPLSIITMVHQGLSLTEIEALRDYADTIGAEIVLSPILPLGNAIQHRHEIMPAEGFMDQALKLVNQEAHSGESQNPNSSNDNNSIASEQPPFTQCPYFHGKSITVFPDGILGVGGCRFDYRRNLDLAKMTSPQEIFASIHQANNDSSCANKSRCMFASNCPLYNACQVCSRYSEWYFDNAQIPTPICILRFKEENHTNELNHLKLTATSANEYLSRLLNS
jgi:MoaA/NifB/PqqE/SkfB family radical SAM enzyme